MKFTSLTLQNFQTHRNVTVEFAPGVTTIVGATDRGKSAIIRALRWVALNDIAGDEFIREGAKRTKVTLRGDAATTGTVPFTIVRSKGKGGAGNTYTLGEAEHKAFGQGVPQDIAFLLRVNEINFQAQHNSPFWFCETGGGVSRKLNAVIDLSVIDNALGCIAGKVRTSQERLSIATTRLEESRERQQESLVQLRRAKEFRELEQQHLAFIALTEKELRLQTAIRRIKLSPWENWTARAADGERVRGAMRAMLDTQTFIESLGAVCEGIHKHKAASVAPPPFGPVIALCEGWRQTKGRAVALAALLHSAQKLLARVVALDVEQGRAETKFHQTIKGRTCPLCRNRFPSQ